ncbi:MAG: Gfo/Idh/MocA family oxidoreductase [Spirochaetia bacterium]|jgi:predicted dehydrogenase|nr:Gfo/Idh/MocA family oxidoreductase [Spirochaetia bacterium]
MSVEKIHRVGIIMNGVTGRMGKNQHLLRSIIPIIHQGGISVSDEEIIMPDPILVGRNENKLKVLAAESGIDKWSTDLNGLLQDPKYSVYFDATMTNIRAANIEKAIRAGKNIYCEKPTAMNLEDALRIYNLAIERGVKHGVVQDKLWLPGIMKLKDLIDRGYFGRIFSVRGEFGYWVFEGDTVPSQRPSWNYKKAEGGGIIFDMLCHWQYLLENTFGRVKSLSCLGALHIDKRWDENGNEYQADAEDAAYSTFQIDGANGEIVAHFNSSWQVRVRRDDLLTIQVDGTEGSAVVGLRECWIQPYGATPKPIWNPDIPSSINHFDNWIQVPEQRNYDNAFKVQWELFLRHLVLDEPFQWGLQEGAKGVQFAEKGFESWSGRKWADIPKVI